MRAIFFTIALLLTLFGKSQTSAIKLLTTPLKTNYRGLCVVNKNVIWASGSNGQVSKSTDGGKTWETFTVAGFEKADFRDIYAFSKKEAVVIVIGEGGNILRTSDGGKSWQKVYENNAPGMFLDALDFRNKKEGIVVGDPINNQFFIAITKDGGKSWQIDASFECEAVPQKGEAFFAASGSNILLGKNDYTMVSGGAASRLLTKTSAIELPLTNGDASIGANALAINPRTKTIVIVGGDYAKKEERKWNCAIIKKGLARAVKEADSPSGYRSGIAFISKKSFVACGLNGVDISQDDGQHWQNISKESYNVVVASPNGKAIFLAGSEGKIARLYP